MMVHKKIGVILILLGAVLGAVDLAQLGIDVPMDAVSIALLAGGNYLLTTKDD